MCGSRVNAQALCALCVHSNTCVCPLMLRSSYPLGHACAQQQCMTANARRPKSSSRARNDKIMGSKAPPRRPEGHEDKYADSPEQ